MSRYAAPMLSDPRTASPLPVRVAAVSVSSVLLGVLAHGSMAGVLPRPGSLFVIVVLVVMLVGGLLAAGHGAGRWVQRRGWPLPVEDLAGAAALVVGQALVHWLVIPVGAPQAVALPSGNHVHAVAASAEAVVSHHSGSATGPGMLAVHAVAGLMVAVALRWVEAAILGVVQVLRFVRAPTASWLGALRAAILVPDALPTGGLGDLSWSWGRVDVRPRLRVTLLPLQRRGPPGVGRTQIVLPA